MSKGERITLFLTVISCVAALVVVPEVRTALGLDGGGEMGFAGTSAESELLPLIGGRRAPVSGRAEEAVVAGIRGTYQAIEARRNAFADHRLGVRGAGGDSAYATVYTDGGDVPLVRLRVFDGEVRNSLLFYYAGGDLRFIHQVALRILPSGGETGQVEHRYYFDGGRMVRWLDERGTPVSPDERAFADNERRLRTAGAAVYRAARDGKTIRL